VENDDEGSVENPIVIVVGIGIGIAIGIGIGIGIGQSPQEEGATSNSPRAQGAPKGQEEKGC